LFECNRPHHQDRETLKYLPATPQSEVLKQVSTKNYAAVASDTLAGRNVLDRDLSVSNTCNTEFNDVGFARVLNTKLNELPGGGGG